MIPPKKEETRKHVRKVYIWTKIPSLVTNII